MTSDAIFDLAVRQAVQVSVLIVAVWVVTRILGARRPHLCYMLWMLVMVKAVTPPVWSSPVGVFSWANVQRREAPQRVQSMVGEVDVPVVAKAKALPAIDAPRVHPQDDLQFVWIVWGVGFFSVSGVLAVRWAIIGRRIVRSGVAAPAELAGVVEEICGQLSVPGRVGTCLCGKPIGPAVFGFIRPIVILPQAVLNDVDGEGLRQILAHEIIHIRRRDPLISGVQFLVQAIWWFHPLVWWMNQRINEVREICCDAEVLATRRCEPGRYAQVLIDVARRRRKFTAMRPVMGIGGARVTRRRLEYIMTNAQSGNSRTPFRYWLAFAVCALVLLPGAGLLRDVGGSAARAGSDAISTTKPSVAQQREVATLFATKLLELKQLREQLQSDFDQLKARGLMEANPRLEQLQAELEQTDMMIEQYRAEIAAGDVTTAQTSQPSQPNAQPASQANRTLYDFLGQPVAPPVGLNAIYTKAGLTVAMQQAAKDAKVSLKKLEIDDSEFPYLVGVVTEKGDVDKLNAAIKKMAGFAYQGSVSSDSGKAMNIIPFEVWPRADRDRIERRLNTRLQVLFYKIGAE